MAKAGRWRALRGDLGAAAVDGLLPQKVARMVSAMVGRPPTEEEAGDFTTTVAAVLAHDTLGALPALRIPTLVIGGARDPFFPEAALRDTAAAIPGAQLGVFARNGHGVPKHQAARLQESVARFLAG